MNAYDACNFNRLNWIHNNQKKICVNFYNDLNDMLNNSDIDMIHLDWHFILSFSTSVEEWVMHQLLQNTYCLIQNYRCFLLFITFTANSVWSEIQNALFSHQTAVNCFDIVTCVFKLKQIDLLTQLIKKWIFDTSVANTFIIEFQKCDLSHVHLLLFLHRDNHVINVKQIDDTVLICLLIEIENLNDFLITIIVLSLSWVKLINLRQIDSNWWDLSQIFEKIN